MRPALIPWPTCPPGAAGVLAYVLTFNLFDIGGGAAVATISFLLLAGIVSLYLWLFPVEEA